MKKKVLAALLLGMCVTLAGCGNKTEKKETEKVTEATTSAATEASTEKATEAATEASTNAGTSTVQGEPEYKALDYVELGQYKGLEFTVSSSVVTEEDIQKQIYADCRMNGKLVQATEGTVEEGDTVNIDYVGKVDGVEFDGGADKGHDLTIGSGAFIPGFEDGLIGAAAGTTVDVPVTFPENYHNTDLAGVDAVFTVTINYINEIPELTDELVEKISIYTNVDKYLAGVKAVAEDTKANQLKDEKYSKIVDLLHSGAKIKGYPADVIEYRLAETIAYYSAYAQQYEMEFEDFVAQVFGVGMEEFETTYREYIQESIVAEMLLKAVVEKENITLTDEEYQYGMQQYVESNGMESIEELITYYPEDEIVLSICIDKAYDFVLENAIISEEEPVGTPYETEAAATEEVTEAATTEAATTEGATEAETTEAASEEETTEAGTNK